MGSTVLVVTALEDVTADRVISALNRRDVHVARIDPADIGHDLAFGFGIGQDRPMWGGLLRTGSREVELGEVAAVYYRRPTPYAARFASMPAQQRDFCGAEARHGLGGVLNHLDGALYVNHPAAVTAADFKPAQLKRFAELGLAIPPTLVTNDVEAARKFAADHEQVVYKTFRGLPRDEDGHTGAIWAQRVDPAEFDDSLAVTAHLFQAEIPKTGDVRVTVVGRTCVRPADRCSGRRAGLALRRLGQAVPYADHSPSARRGRPASLPRIIRFGLRLLRLRADRYGRDPGALGGNRVQSEWSVGLAP
ncbi:MvdC/MvdD family ATP grasp protein [Streptomyces sp. NPDC053499]|uniref:MvdC/MvdD family ATP grasp protein n=1 Tax=Streptomyces sp. NPDC053499 TaxID=3365707 RepID=UPI0037D23C38